MEFSGIAHADGWRAVLIQAGLLVLGAFSVIILLSFGGQVVAAPGLLPAQWLVARSTGGWVSKAFSILGGLLLLEVVPIAAVVLLGDGGIAVGGGVLVALIGATVFYRTSQERQ